MTVKDLRGQGYLIQDELVNFIQMMDVATDRIGSMAYLDMEPGVYSLELWTGANKSGDQIPVQLAGSVPDTGKALLLDPSRGLILAGDTVPITVYASYYGFGTPVRSLELSQAYYARTITFPLFGQIQDGQTYVRGIRFPVSVRADDIVIVFQVPPSGGNAVFTVQDDLAGTNTITVTVQDGNAVSNGISDTLTIHPSGELVIKCTTGSGASDGYVFIRLGTAKGTKI